MNKALLFIVTFYFLVTFCSCVSKAKIELRGTNTGCLVIPEGIFRDPNEKDTSMGVDKIFLNQLISFNKKRVNYEAD